MSQLNHSHHDEQAVISPNPDHALGVLISYTVGLIASLIIVWLSYQVVTKHLFPESGLYFFLGVAAILQLLVSALFFFRLNTATDHDRWNVVIFLFSLLIMLIVIAGSLWIMYQLNYNMMI